MPQENDSAPSSPLSPSPSSQIHELPGDVLSSIFSHLTVSDLLSVRQASKALCSAVDAHSDLWQSSYTSNFGDIMEYVSIFNDSLGFDFDANAFQPPDGWKSKLQKRLTASAQIVQDEETAALDLFKEAHRLMNECKEHPNKASENIDKALPLLFQVLDTMPTHAPSFHLLAVICFLLNGFQQSMRFIEFCEGVDGDYKEHEDLKRNVALFIEKTGATEHHAALIEDGDLSDEFAQVLRQLFQRYDADRDGSLSRSELDAYVFATNQHHLTTLLWQSFRQVFQCDSRGNLTLDGFMQMYLKQTLDDPEETWKDMRSHGYDSFLCLDEAAKTA